MAIETKEQVLEKVLEMEKHWINMLHEIREVAPSRQPGKSPATNRQPSRIEDLGKKGDWAPWCALLRTTFTRGEGTESTDGPVALI